MLSFFSPIDCRDSKKGNIGMQKGKGTRALVNPTTPLGKKQESYSLQLVFHTKEMLERPFWEDLFKGSCTVTYIGN